MLLKVWRAWRTHGFLEPMQCRGRVEQVAWPQASVSTFSPVTVSSISWQNNSCPRSRECLLSRSASGTSICLLSAGFYVLSTTLDLIHMTFLFNQRKNTFQSKSKNKLLWLICQMLSFWMLKYFLLQQNQDPGCVCGPNPGVCVQSTHWAPRIRKLRCSQTEVTRPGGSNCRWAVNPIGLPPGLPSCGRADWKTHAFWCYIPLPRPSTHHCC